MFVFLLPYVCASLWGHVGKETEKLRQTSIVRLEGESAEHKILVSMDWGVWEIPMEEYLVYKLSTVMPKTYEKEALKAQAVLLRTELVQALKEQEDQELLLSGDGQNRWYELDISMEEFEIWRQAVEETDGLYLSYEGEAIQASYFQISNGQTRDASEVWDTHQRPYLRSVSCMQDKAARNYGSTVSVSRADYICALQEKLQSGFSEAEIWEGASFTYDTAGYVTAVSFTAQDKEPEQIDGESFRYLFDLPSASFEMKKEERQMIFRVTGVGHGFGMSQYGANCMALNGETYDQILQKFFYRTELTKFE